MSTKIKAFTSETNKEYIKHEKVWIVCSQAGVSIPIETLEYFNGCDKPEDRLEFNLLEGHHYHNWSTEMQEGFEVNLDELPEGVTKIRFYNSY